LLPWGVVKVPSSLSSHAMSTASLAQLKIESLQDAAKAGDVEAAKKLLADGADVDGKDTRGITPLGVAVGFNKIPIIKEFLEAGADVEVTDPKGNTALHYAAGGPPSPPPLLPAVRAS